MPGPADTRVNMTDTLPALSELAARRYTISNNPTNESIIANYNCRSPSSNGAIPEEFGGTPNV